jgi:hypothetical protein
MLDVALPVGLPASASLERCMTREIGRMSVGEQDVVSSSR